VVTVCPEEEEELDSAEPEEEDLEELPE